RGQGLESHRHASSERPCRERLSCPAAGRRAQHALSNTALGERPRLTSQRQLSAPEALRYYRAITLSFGTIRLTQDYLGTGNGFHPLHRAGLGHAGLVYPANAADRPAQVALGQGPYWRTPGAAVCPLAAG